MSEARATRAYLAGFGTAGSLLAGAALLFVLATAYVSFAGWPKIGDAPGPSSVVVTPAADSQGQPSGRLALIAARNGGLLPGLATVGGSSGALTIVGNSARGVGLNLGIGASGRQQSSSGGGKTGGPGPGGSGSGGGGGGGTGGCTGSQCVITPPGTPGVPNGPAQNIVQQTEKTVTRAANSVGSTAQGAVRKITKGAGSGGTGAVGRTVNGATHSVGGAAGGATGSTGGVTGTVGGATGSVGGAAGGLGH